MTARDLFRINDWKIADFLVVVLSVQFGLLGLAALGALGWEVPLARPIVGFLYLTFVPGALLLRILRVHGISRVESVLYMAGLSLAFDMLAGFLINALCPYVGIDRPITEGCILASMLAGTLALAALCYVRDRGHGDAGAALDLDAKTLAPALFLLLLPPIGAASAYAVNVYGTNLLVYVAIGAAAAVVAMCGFGRFIPERLYPLAIVSVAATLLFHNAFVSGYLWSWDVHHEYNVAHQVIASGAWDTSIVSNLNSMLSVVFLAPFYHHVCGLELTWVFKIPFQLLYCLVPLGLYAAFRRQAGGRIACLSCMFFMSLVTFFTEMQGLTRQEIAELFLALIIVLMADAALSGRVKASLMVAFGIALVVSHYGLAYIYLLVFPLALALLTLVALAQKLPGTGPRGLRRALRPALPSDRALTLTFVGAFVCFLFFWYSYTSEAATLRSIGYILYRILANVAGEFLDPDNVQGLGMIVQGSASPLFALKKYMHLIFQGFIVIGFALVALQGVSAVARRQYRFSVEYVAMAFLNLLTCLFAITLPYFASSLNTSRLYQITLIVLAPLCIIGGLGLIRAAISPLRLLKVETGGPAMAILTLIVVVYLFFNTGLIFAALDDHPMSVALSKARINEYSLNDRAGLYDALNTFEQDYYAAGWLAGHRAAGRPVYSDYIAHYPVSSYGNTTIADERYFDRNLSNIGSDSYIYIGYANLKGDVVREITGDKSVFRTSQLLPELERRNKVYTNDACVIYRVP